MKLCHRLVISLENVPDSDKKELEDYLNYNNWKWKERLVCEDKSD